MTDPIAARQHIPPSIDTGSTAETATAATLTELLAAPWIRQWTALQTFARWSVADADTGQPLLMAEMTDGKYWVVAYLTTDAPLDLPAWTPPRV